MLASPAHCCYGHFVTLSRPSERTQRDSSWDDTRQVDAKVIALVPQFKIAKIRSADGHLYSINENTPGVRLSELEKGKFLHITVTKRLARVLRAELLNHTLAF
jgi:hypothetical protein